MKIKSMVRRTGGMYFPLDITDSGGQGICISWVEAARLVGELRAEIQDRDSEVQAQRKLDARAAEMIATTATIPPVGAT